MTEVLIPERLGELLGSREPVRRKLLQRTTDCRVDVGRDGWTLLSGRNGLAGDDLAEHRLGRRAREGGFADQQLVEHAAERVGVACRANSQIARGLFGAHVEGSTHAQASLCEAGATCRPDGKGDPEVGDQGSAVTQKNVRGFDVPVDHSLPVRVVQRLGQIRRYLHCLVHVELLLPIESVAERFPLHIRHHVEEEAVRLTRVEEREDVRVLEVGRDLDLGQKALGAHHRGQLWLEDLEGDLALVLQVVGQIDRGHPALAELALNVVAALEGRVQAVDGDGAHVRRTVSGGQVRTWQTTCA